MVADALDRDAVMGAVLGAEPEVIVHQMTALTGATNLKHFDRVFATTNRLRTEGTRHLLDAARAARHAAADRPELHRLAVRARRRPGQGRGRAAGPRAAAAQRESLAAIRELEALVGGADVGSRAWCCATAASTARDEPEHATAS